MFIKVDLETKSVLTLPFYVFGSKGLQHQGIFRVSGSQLEVNDIKNSFERGEQLQLQLQFIIMNYVL